jgi:hypothetical protein
MMFPWTRKTVGMQRPQLFRASSSGALCVQRMENCPGTRHTEPVRAWKATPERSDNRYTSEKKKTAHYKRDKGGAESRRRKAD